MSAIPKLYELTALMQTAIRANALISSKAISVIVDEGLQDSEISTALETKGAVVLVLPVMSLSRRDQSGSSAVLEADLTVKLMVNPKANVDQRTNLNIYEAIVAIITALVKYARHPGGEFFKAAETVCGISAFDPGLWVYDLFFTKECVL
jgi:hypothetical protein